MGRGLSSNEVGIGPEKLFFSSIRRSFVNLPKDVGMVPPKFVSPRYNLSRLPSLPKELGIVPERPVLWTSNWYRRLKSPIESGIDPEMPDTSFNIMYLTK